VQVLIEAMPDRPSYTFMLDRSKHVLLGHFLKEVCQQTNIRTD
jgi:hypothetical protein